MTGAQPFDQTLVTPGHRMADLVALAEEYGTPLFVYDEDEIRNRMQRYVSAFGEGHVAYAGKAFLCRALIQIVSEEGLHLDVATGGELHVALNAGMPADRIVMHGNNKSEAEISAALDAGVGRIVADSFDEIGRLERLARLHGARPRVLVRVTPGVEAHTHEFIETGTEASKFGFTVTNGIALKAALAVARSDVLEFVGLHCHIGSQIYVVESFAKAAAVVMNIAKAIETETGQPIGEINLGGGLGVRYLHDDPEVTIEDFAAVLKPAFAAACVSAGLIGNPRLMVEPGRSIVAPTALTMYEIGTIKEIPGIGTYVAVDGGMSDNPRPVLYGAGYEAFLPARMAEDRPLRCVIVGKHCEQGDVLVHDAHLPAATAVGDILAMPTTGAYSYSMASNYNLVERPAVVFLRYGMPRLVVRRETAADLHRLDVDRLIRFGPDSPTTSDCE